MTQAFVLTRGYVDTRSGVLLEYWLSSERGPLRVRRIEKSSLFVERSTATRAGERKASELLAPNGQAVDALYFDSQRALVAERDRLRELGVPVFEGDVKPADRFLMERFITGACDVRGESVQCEGFVDVQNAELKPLAYRPKLRSASLDIETVGFDGKLLCIGITCDDFEHVFMVGTGEPPTDTTLFASEREVLEAFAAAIRALDPDLIVGWNVIEFDLAYLCKRARELGVRLRLGRDGSEPQVLPGKPALGRIAGRLVLDGIVTLRAASHQFESYALDDVGQQLLGRGKLIEKTSGDRLAEIVSMYERDREALARYNLEDCRLARDIFMRVDLVGFLIERSLWTGLALDRPRGSVAAFDFLYLPRLHRAGYVAPTVDPAADPKPSPGGYVLDSAPGLYDNVIVLDFKSLYPSIIRTFFIDPLALFCADDDAVPGFEGARFHRTRHILPELITTLWHNRDEAKRQNDAARSQAIKILMNSFYGVLGTPACRFFDPKLASSITLRGHEIITRSREQIEASGYRVIYGDTDSLFVRLEPQRTAAECERIGHELAARLNQFWREAIEREHRLTSCLEVEFDTHYARFFMPTLRNSELGSKKRYAGLVRNDGGERVEFTGLEAVRTDWTPLARRFQRELFRRIFNGEPYEEYIRNLKRELLRGQHDAELVYRKRVRRELDDYVKNVPPHVRAARLLTDPGRIVSYCMTVRGPEPALERRSSFDYTHYLQRQLAPAADGILHHVGTSFAELTDDQLSLF
ncbi:MAG TPA: DNA polymerase II [Polyangiales bacterium]